MEYKGIIGSTLKDANIPLQGPTRLTEKKGATNRKKQIAIANQQDQ